MPTQHDATMSSPITYNSPSAFDTTLADIMDAHNCSQGTPMITPSDAMQLALYNTVTTCTPVLYHHLVAAKAYFWAGLALDVNNCLWARMFQKLSGREPSKMLFSEVYQEAVDCQTMLSDGDSWEHVLVTLDAQIGDVLNPKDTLRVVEKVVETTPFNADFMNVLKVSQASIACLPHAIANFSIGLLSPRSKFTTQYCARLKALLHNNSIGMGLLHQQPSIGDHASSEFSLFGNTIFQDIIHHALYDPQYPGYQVQEADKLINEHITPDYIQAPSNFMAYCSVESIGKLATHLGNCFSFLCGGTGDAAEMSQYKPFKDMVKNTNDFNQSVAAYLHHAFYTNVTNNGGLSWTSTKYTLITGNKFLTGLREHDENKESVLTMISK
ncbi:hypothetical protein BDN67DRAFT_986004 [Paxillus ammoniavirescens]|nr:hypothetical protein BDN67DRAFT_986004 [Paxillus ammoniavirescens]